MKKSEKMDLTNDIQNSQNKQDIMNLYQKVKNKEISLENIESDKLYKIMILLNEEVKMRYEEMAVKCNEVKSHLNNAIMYNKQVETGEKMTICKQNMQNEDKKDFIASIKCEDLQDKIMLLKLQDEIEAKGINPENVYELTKDLTETQKEKLKKLYQTQIKEYETSIENYKRKILRIKNNM